MGAGTLKRSVWGTISGLAVVTVLAGCERELILPGERFPVRADLEASIQVEGEAAPVAPPDRPENRAEPISLPAAVSNADWGMRGASANHASVHGALSPAPARAWSVSIGAGNSRKNRVSAAPVVADGRIFTLDAASVVQATSAAGAVLWRADLTATFDRGGGVSGGGLAVEGGRVYAATAYGELVALDAASGGVVWRQRLDAPVTGAPAVSGGTVYVSGRDGSGWALEADNGRVRWTVPGAVGSTGVVGSAAPSVGEQLVLFPFANGSITAALKVSGLQVWQAPVTGQRVGRGYAGLTDITGDAVVLGDVTYVGTASGRTAAMDTSSGERIWTAVEGALNPPLVVGGSVFLVNDENRLVRLDAATGEVIWAVDMPYFTKEKPKRRIAIFPQFGPVLAGGRLAVVSGDGQLRLFNPVDGALVGGAEIPGGASAPPALAGGTLYVVSDNGQLHAFR
ncbi:PQQ-binding-like beta-propeller repeat protein [Fuscovulum ytuae]|uniref:PQQ-binding-like beta-propeller repeat protein n=1 Tax=Fuscovulum ytuae TaxID=3042299 RepID=A0ABY8Q8C1_9RHOB|nr:PQQ-binding-like beta-propeller repeat protein [Fuscovulum sp. YMD61]WGV17120.1 PQQ-binding-like beta-propeller repeat protein [Fuscovulum sp. YMD61]